MGHAPRDILGIKAAVKADGGIEAVNDFIRFLPKTAPPHFVIWESLLTGHLSFVRGLLLMVTG